MEISRSHLPEKATQGVPAVYGPDPQATPLDRYIYCRPRFYSSFRRKGTWNADTETVAALVNLCLHSPLQDIQ